MRWLSRFARSRPDRSDERDGAEDEGKGEDGAPHGPLGRDHSIHDRSDERTDDSDEARDSAGEGKNEDGAERIELSEDFGRESLHGGYSLLVSAAAAMVMVGANLVELEHMQPWQVFGGLVGYFVGVLAYFTLDRRQYRRRRARPVPDRTGGGRQALTIAAVAFCLAGSEATAGLAGWIALSALALGAAADGAWLALVAERRGIGLWGALRELGTGGRSTQERYWAALFRKGGR